MAVYLEPSDSGMIVIFLDAFTAVPGVGPDSDMDGHDLSGLTASEEAEQEQWLEAFNNNYADKATIKSFFGMPMCFVKDFYDNKILDIDRYEDDELPADEKVLSGEELEKSVEMAKQNWEQFFMLTPSEVETYEAELRKRLQRL